MVTTSKLDAFVDWMLKRGVRHLRVDGVELELEARSRVAAASVDERPMPIPSALADTDGAGVCSCGHSWVEHVKDGCVLGCSWEVCVSSATVDPGP
jgi:hypothetical protein